ncbi:MAG: metalloregulator ArsR/SmtB family transcription factor, partial [Leptolyngbyaceae bacterium]|nr:metalloregulator ArsR/SmtB family transcription factor [Leptolyngbyaceae bacterium]
MRQLQQVKKKVGQKVEQKVEQPVESPSIEMGFQALSDPLRLKVVALLQEQEMCVCDLRDRLDVGQSKLSFHLK